MFGYFYTWKELEKIYEGFWYDMNLNQLNPFQPIPIWIERKSNGALIPDEVWVFKLAYCLSCQ
jgi:hypothetical protein